MYQYAQNQDILVICSGDTVDKKILQSNWLRKFWPISQEQKFSQIWDLCRNTANKNFHYRTNSVKSITEFYSKFKKPIFGPFLVPFPKLTGKNYFPESLVLSCTTSYGFLEPYQNLQKTNFIFPENAHTFRRLRIEGWKDG